jgi:hypothetical protein
MQLTIYEDEKKGLFLWGLESFPHAYLGVEPRLDIVLPTRVKKCQ